MRCYPYGVSDIKAFIALLSVLVVVMVFVATRDPYPQATGVFPQVVSCVQENPQPPTSDKDWQPTVRVKVDPVRRSEGGGRVREYHVLGCTLYYYHGYFK
jgi:hypothetical protein